MTSYQKRIFLIRLGIPVAIVTITLLLSVTYTNVRFRNSRRLGPNINVLTFTHYVGSELNSSQTDHDPYRENVMERIESNITYSANELKNGHLRVSSEVRHIAFLKVHKCASSTMLNILYRFGLKRNLNFVLPIQGNYLEFGSPRKVITEIPPPFNYDYDILCNHVHRFDKDNFARYLPPDTVYLAIVREPFQRMQSAFNYYRNTLKLPLLKRVQGKHPFETYLSKPRYYESQWDDHSFTNNKMARDFGFPLKDFRNLKKFSSYLKFIDKTFDFVMIQELFDESLIFVHRLLNWSMKEILFLVQNAYTYEPVALQNDTKSIAPYLALDNMLYNHFLDKLKKRIISEGQGFQDEVSYFRSINNKTIVFCSSGGKKKKLLFSANDWHGDFSISRHDCSLMKKLELPFLYLVRDTQIDKLKTFGANLTKFLERPKVNKLHIHLSSVGSFRT